MPIVISPKKHEVTLKWSKLIHFKLDYVNSVPEQAGVYEILERTKKNDEKYVLSRRYVGQADNLRERFRQHLSESEPDTCIKDLAKDVNSHFDYTLVEDEDDRKDAEQALYDKYRPKCNDIRPAGSGRQEIEIEEIIP